MQDYVNKVLQGDALTRLKELESDSIDCIITSPPYWALRDYKVDGQIGIEKTIDEYVNNLIKVFDECKRVLKKEGTCWIVLGDTYAGHKGDMRNPGYKDKKDGYKYVQDAVNKRDYWITEAPEKSLCMIPERFAIKMIDNKWILRNKIIWWKPNCMPSSAKDRFTVDYEYIYFFTKSKKYYFKTQYEPQNINGHTNHNPKIYRISQAKYQKEIGISDKAFLNPPNPLGRIKRSVWTINTKPFSEAHFAVFPEELVKQCLDAGCPDNGIILDCFMGSGTTASVALKNNRKFIGIELNPDYIAIAQKRIEPYLLQSRLI